MLKERLLLATAVGFFLLPDHASEGSVVDLCALPDPYSQMGAANPFSSQCQIPYNSVPYICDPQMILGRTAALNLHSGL